MSVGGDELTSVHTMRGRNYPSIRQFSIFCPNKVGQLTALVKHVESAKLRVCALSIVDSADCAIIRMVTTHPERAYEIYERSGYQFTEVDLLVVELPTVAQPLLAICSALLRAEINIHYSYPLLVRPYGNPALAFHVDAHELASQVLTGGGFTLLTEEDLES